MQRVYTSLSEATLLSGLPSFLEILFPAPHFKQVFGFFYVVSTPQPKQSTTRNAYFEPHFSQRGP